MAGGTGTSVSSRLSCCGLLTSRNFLCGQGDPEQRGGGVHGPGHTVGAEKVEGGHR